MAGSLLIGFTYAAVVVFVGAILVRAYRMARLPMHLRWELYPVAHEKGRARYGGSYLEEPDWWTKPRQVSLAGELKVMVPEIVLLAGVWEHNRRHWLRTFPFHFGLYLLAALIALLLAGGIAVAAGVEVSASAGIAGRALFHLTCVVGYAGLVLGLLGALGLLARRTLEADYREYTKKADYFNLAFFIATFVVALAGHALTDPYFVDLRDFFARLVTFDFSANAASPGGWVAAEILLASLLFAYIPLTHMAHFFTKWFMYHDVRWSDEPNVAGGKIERAVAQAVQFPVSWSAPHIEGDGKKTWADIAQSGIEEDNQAK